MNNEWTEQFGIEFPACKMTGQCCNCASPSTASYKLMEKAAEGNDFAREFFSIFIPYSSVEEARQLFPHSVERSLKACQKADSEVKPEDVVFYHCRYIDKDNKCLVHEDRPQLCRNYPDSPFLVFPPGCAYEGWAKECREKYTQLKAELEKLKDYKKELVNLKYQQKVIVFINQMQRVNNKDFNFMALCSSIAIVSPGRSWIKIS